MAVLPEVQNNITCGTTVALHFYKSHIVPGEVPDILAQQKDIGVFGAVFRQGIAPLYSKIITGSTIAGYGLPGLVVQKHRHLVALKIARHVLFADFLYYKVLVQKWIGQPG